MKSSVLLRERRKNRQRYKMRACSKPRLVIYRSNKNVYAQIIEAKTGNVLFSASSVSRAGRKLSNKGWTVETAEKIGQAIGNKAVAGGITEVVFDRSGSLYHGRVKAIADGARAAGLVF